MRGALCLSVTILFLQLGMSANASEERRTVPETRTQISNDLHGKVCTSRVGASFAFSHDGRYTYDGLWHDTGRYRVHDGAVEILFDDGLQRDFSISRRGSTLLMEETAIVCV